MHPKYGQFRGEWVKDLRQKIHTTVQPVFESHKIEQDLRLQEFMPPVVNQQCLDCLQIILNVTCVIQVPTSMHWRLLKAHAHLLASTSTRILVC